MAIPRRSTAGCTACKHRHKKCDEGKPQCARCLTSGIPCKYDFIRYPDNGTHLIQRTKPAPRPIAELLAQTATNSNGTSTLATLNSIADSLSTHSTSHLSTQFAHADSFAMENNDNINSSAGGLRVFTLTTRPIGPRASLSNHNQTDDSDPPPGCTQSIVRNPHNATFQPTGLASQDVTWACHGDSEIPREDPDPEGIHVILYAAPGMDMNLQENTLPFVLQCYSRWALVSVFEPLKIAHAMKEQIVQQFQFEGTRTRYILMANVMDMFGRQLVLDETRLSIVAHLTSGVRTKISTFVATPSFEFLASELDRQNAAKNGTAKCFVKEFLTFESMRHHEPVHTRAGCW